MPRDRRAYMREYNQRDDVKARCREWQKAHRKAHRVEQREYHRIYMATYRAEGRQRSGLQARYSAIFRAKHPGYNAKYLAKWQAEHPEETRAQAINRAHQKRANGGRFPRAAWEHLKALFGQCCAYCGRRMERLTQDHVVPISKGGWHFSGNVVPACQPCNSRKGIT